MMNPNTYLSSCHPGRCRGGCPGPTQVIREFRVELPHVGPPDRLEHFARTVVRMARCKRIADFEVLANAALEVTR